jgi:glycosyltransferase involved in cell wall biosynthesis
MSLPRLALLTDYPEERWPSMDLCAEMLGQQLQAGHSERFNAERFCPPFRRRLGLLPLLGRRSFGINADRLLNRMWYYPRAVRKNREAFDFFHVCDHSYSHLVHELPAERTGVFCHDLDTFRCLLQPNQEPRPRWFKGMVRRILSGMQKAAVVFHTTQTVRQEILACGLIDANRLVQAPLGVAAEFQPETIDPDPVASLLDALGGRPFLLHVGSCIPRKRIDVLLDVFAGMQSLHPGLRFIKVGGEWSSAQREQIARLGLETALHHFQGLNRAQLASLYRRSQLVLVTSEKEGFGIPVIEALACGAVVVASDIPPLREAGGAAQVYAPVGDVPAWTEIVSQLLEGRRIAPNRADRLAQAEKFSWRNHAAIVSQAYSRLGR